MQLIIIDKTDLAKSEVCTTLTAACELFEFEYTLGTLQKKEFPIFLKNHVILKKELHKTKYKKTNFN